MFFLATRSLRFLFYDTNFFVLGFPLGLITTYNNHLVDSSLHLINGWMIQTVGAKISTRCSYCILHSWSCLCGHCWRPFSCRPPWTHSRWYHSLADDGTDPKHGQTSTKSITLMDIDILPLTTKFWVSHSRDDEVPSRIRHNIKKVAVVLRPCSAIFWAVGRPPGLVHRKRRHGDEDFLNRLEPEYDLGCELPRPCTHWSVGVDDSWFCFARVFYAFVSDHNNMPMGLDHHLPYDFRKHFFVNLPTIYVSIHFAPGAKLISSCSRPSAKFSLQCLKDKSLQLQPIHKKHNN